MGANKGCLRARHPGLYAASAPGARESGAESLAAPSGARGHFRGWALEQGHQDKALPAPASAFSASWLLGRTLGARGSQLQPPSRTRQ
ncbi:hypothetical protein NDU88_004598 [Pleurodeles waltl]|uniref:Uncharacterized protein n=1 Tax=Pleurodeles waltl TaxID=8319 RepID=A0AAV7TU12_PLEWA|nr:hypothetical protein NDU88_004598 [Pleurodeles waltl]